MTTDAIADGLHTLAVDIDTLTLMPGNPRRGDVEAVAKSLTRFGQRKPIVVNAAGIVLAGNHTVMAARQLGWTRVAAVRTEDDDATGKAFALADNKTAQLGGFDNAELAAMLADVEAADPQLLAAASYTTADLTKLLAGENGPVRPADAPSLADRFLIPPFTVLDARQGWWRARKRNWLKLGLRSEVGRGEHLSFKATSANPDYYDQKRAVEKRLGRTLTHPEFEASYYVASDRASQAAGTSVFDPVLCELVYRWFCPADGLVLDPWAGGSVRGLVAALLGRNYVGIELRGEQVEANAEQAVKCLESLGDTAHPPRWIHGDCTVELPRLDVDADLLFGCPPYFNLEVYSDDPRDLSAMDDAGFAEAYGEHLRLAVERLRPDRFAVLVVSNVRSKRGTMRDLRGLTVTAATAAGLQLYNECVLVTTAGSLPIRTAKMFAGTRAMGRTHQDVLVFVKGDRKRATVAMGELDLGTLADALAQADEDNDDDPWGFQAADEDPAG